MGATSQEVLRNAVADAQGAATVILPVPASRRGWRFSSLVLNVSPASPIPTASVYLGPPGAGQLVAFKRAGDRGTIVSDGETLYTGQIVNVVWAGAAPGATCTARMLGDEA